MVCTRLFLIDLDRISLYGLTKLLKTKVEYSWRIRVEPVKVA